MPRWGGLWRSGEVFSAAGWLVRGEAGARDIPGIEFGPGLPACRSRAIHRSPVERALLEPSAVSIIQEPIASTIQTERADTLQHPSHPSHRSSIVLTLVLILVST